MSCIEGNLIDLRQANAVLRHRPDFIFLEFPSAALRPRTNVHRIGQRVVKKNPWVASTNIMLENIGKLWKTGHKTTVYAIDGPPDLVCEANRYPCNDAQPHKTTNVFWWVRIFLRECFMADRVREFLRRHAGRPSALVLVFVQKFHWKHVRFLLTDPPKKDIYKYYFGRFPRLSRADIEKLVKKEDPILWKHWNGPINPL